MGEDGVVAAGEYGGAVGEYGVGVAVGEDCDTVWVWVLSEIDISSRHLLLRLFFIVSIGHN